MLGLIYVKFLFPANIFTYNNVFILAKIKQSFYRIMGVVWEELEKSGDELGSQNLLLPSAFNRC